MDKGIEAAITELFRDGHRVHLSYLGRKLLFEIDGKMLATPNEMHQLSEGVFTFEELKELFLERKKLENKGIT